jgi:hexosaminidase
MDLYLYPRPKRWRKLRNEVDLTGRRLLKIDRASPPRLQRALARLASARALDVTVGNATRPAVIVRPFPATPPANIRAQGFELRVRESIEILPADECGAYYGTMAALSLLDQSRILPHMQITDFPDIDRRGVMLDISRCKVPERHTLFGLIDRLTALRCNELQLYTEHTFAYVNHETVWRDSSPLTAADIIAIRDYCADRYIDLVPNINTFGHMQRWLQHPEYHHYAECPQGFTHPLSGQRMPTGSTLKPDADSLALVDELLTEYLPLFTSPMVNIGGDEPWDLGSGATRERCEREGKINVYLGFLAQIEALVTGQDRRMQFWADIVLNDPACLDQLSGDLTAMIWGYEASHPWARQCELLADSETPFYVCPGTSSWLSLTGRGTDSLDNLRRAAVSAKRFGATGYLTTDWGDNGHHQYQPVSYLGFLAGLCFSWNVSSATRFDAAHALGTCFFDDLTTGRLFVKLSQVMDLASARIHNSTIFHHLFFWNMQGDPPARLTADEVAACSLALEEIAADAASARPSDRLVLDELLQTARMCEHGLERYRAGTGEAVNGPPPGDLREIIHTHRQLWLQRNRPGGLEESVGYLEESLTALV